MGKTNKVKEPTEKEVIILCKMFSGNYWEDENNIGYESINMFLPNGQENEKEPISYIYLPANGDYNKYDKVDGEEIKRIPKYVVLTQHIKGNGKKSFLKVIGVAEVDKNGDLLEEDIKKAIQNHTGLTEYKCLSGGREFDSLVAVYQVLGSKNPKNSKEIKDDEIKQILSQLKLSTPQNHGDRYDILVEMAFLNKKVAAAIKAIAKITSQKVADVETDIKNANINNNKAPTKLTLEHIKEYVKNKGLTLPNCLQKSEEQFTQIIFEKYQKAKLLSKIHEYQKERVKEVKYNKLPLTELYSKNSSFGVLNILTTLRVKNLKYPERNIFVTNDKEQFKDIIKDDDEVFEIEETLSTENQYTFIEYDENIIKKINENSRMGECLSIDNFEEGFEPSFLTRIKKEYDELSYSNLFAYFFSISSNFLTKFFNEVKIDGKPLNLKVKGNVSEGRKIKDEEWGEYTTELCLSSVQREKKNIDIIVEGDEIVVIENKIKSALNGKPEKDINGDFIKNQLKKYYKYIERQYANEKEKHYFIFAPNYNPVHKENFGEVDGVMMNEKWRVIRYADIYEFCCAYDYKNDKNFSAHDKTLYREFLKALKVHTVDSLQNYYRDMQIRMRKLFNE